MLVLSPVRPRLKIRSMHSLVNPKCYLPPNMGIPEPRRRKKHISPLRIIPILPDYPFKYCHVSTICVLSHFRLISISHTWLKTVIPLQSNVVAYHPFATQSPRCRRPERDPLLHSPPDSPDGSFLSSVEILRCSVQKRVVRSGKKKQRSPKRNGMQSSNLRGVAFPAK